MLLALSLGLRGLWSSRLNSLCGVEGGRVLWWQVELEGCRRVRFVCVVVVCVQNEIGCVPREERSVTH